MNKTEVEAMKQAPLAFFHAEGIRNFQMTFENGYRISIAFGKFAYVTGAATTEDGYISSSNSAEVAVFDPDDNFIKFESSGEDICPHSSPDKIADIMYWAKSQPAKVK